MIEMGRMFYKYSVWMDDGKTFWSNTTTEKAAIAAIIDYYGISSSTARKMWVRNNETGMLIGMVNRLGNRFTYETTDGRERYVNKDGTFVKKPRGTNAFGLDLYLK